MNRSRQMLHGKWRLVTAESESGQRIEGPMGEVMAVISERITINDPWDIMLVNEDDE